MWLASQTFGERGMTISKFEVTAIARSPEGIGGIQSIHFGDFTARSRAEDCLIQLSRRPDIYGATIREVSGTDER